MLRESRMRALVVVAHPDDETIFFGGLVRSLVASNIEVDVVCATGEFDSVAMTRVRRAEFRYACRLLRVRAIQLDFPDRPGPLDVVALEKILRQLASEQEAYEAVYTHGAWGEYGHHHHSDVCLAVHRAFRKRVFSLAGPLVPALTQILTPAEMATKRSIVARAYMSQQFASRWCTEEERFVRLSLRQVEFLAKIIAAEATSQWQHLALPGLADGRLKKLVQCSKENFSHTAAPFPDIEHIPPEIWLPVHAARHQILTELLAESEGRTSVVEFRRSPSQSIQAGSGTCRRKARRGERRRP